MPKFTIRWRKPAISGETFIAIVLGALALFPELPLWVRVILIIMATVFLFLNINLRDESDVRNTTQAEIIAALRAVVSRKQVWTCNWRVILYRLGHPGDDKLYAAAIFQRAESLPIIEGWKHLQWPSAPWMQSYVRWHLQKHMENQGWSLNEHPNYILRQWDNNATLNNIAEEIIEVAQKTGISLDEMKCKKIGEITP